MAQFNIANGSFLESGTSVYEVNFTSSASLVGAPFEIQVARGKVDGVSLVELNGFQPNLGNTYIPIWENATEYVYPPSGGISMRLYSSSASDTAVQIRINGLDVNYEPITEDITLTNGITGVTTSNSYRRINNMSTIGTVNAIGILRLASDDKVTTYAQIDIGVGRTQMSMYNVPAGYSLFITRVQGFVDSTSGPKVLSVRIREQTDAGLIFNIVEAPWDETYINRRITPLVYNEKDSLQWQMRSDTSSQVGIRIEGYLIRNGMI